MRTAAKCPVERMVRRQCFHLTQQPVPLLLFLERALLCQPKVAYLLTFYFPRDRVIALVLQNVLFLQGEEQGCAVILRGIHNKRLPPFPRLPKGTPQISHRFSFPFDSTIYRRIVQQQNDVLLRGFVPLHLVEHTFLRCDAVHIGKWHRILALLF